MKKLALLFVFSAVVVMTANAQLTKETYQGCHTVPHFQIPGLWGIDLHGEICETHTFWFLPIFPYPVKHNGTVRGELTDDDGNVFTFQHAIHNRNEGVENLVGAFHATSTWTSVVRLNGKPFGVIHFTHHITRNPDGELITEFGKMSSSFH